MLRILTTNITREFESMTRRFSDVNGRIDGMNSRIDSVAAEMRQRFDRMHQELAENRERMARIEGAREGFLAGRRDRDAARFGGRVERACRSSLQCCSIR